MLCREYAKPNRCVFKCFAKDSKLKEEDLKPTGKTFQLLGPATAKDLKPQSVCLMTGNNNVTMSSRLCRIWLCVCTPLKDYLHNNIVFDHCQLFLQLFPQHSWPEFIFCHNIGIVKVSHANFTSVIHIPWVVCVNPPKKNWVFAKLQSLWPLPTFPQYNLATIHILPQHRHCKKTLILKFKIFFPYLPLSVCCPPPLKKEHLHNYIIFDHCQLFSQHSTSPVQIWDNMGRVKVYQKNLTFLCRSSWVSPKI